MVCATSQPCYPKDFYQLIINFLCQIKNALQPTASGIRYDWEILCDSATGDPVAVRYAYLTNGTLQTTTAYNLDGTTYSGVIGDLVACGSDSTGIVRYDYNVLCDPDTGFPVLLRFAYHIDGLVTGVTAFNPDGTTYGGSLADLLACAGGEGGVFNGYSFQTVCDASTGAPLLLRIHYNPDGSIDDTAAFQADGSVFPGPISTLAACSTIVEEGVWYPTPDTSSIIANPGVGLQSVGKTVAATNTGGFNPLNYPIRCAHFRYPWQLIEASEGVYNFDDIRVFLNKAGQYNQVVNFRIYEFDPGSGYDVPDYAYTYAGWEVTYAGSGPTVFRLCYWGNANVLNGFANMLAALYTAIGTHPALGSIDVGWGAYNENTYSGTAYTGTSSGSVPPATIGLELPSLTLAEAQGFYDVYAAAIPGLDILKVSMIASVPSFNYGVGHYLMGQRLDGFGFRNNPGGCPGGGSNMCTEVPATIVSPGTLPLSWTFNQRIAETYGTIYSGALNWLSSGWDFAASFTWGRVTGHISEYNVKQQFNPPSSPTNIRTPFETMLKGSGFRYTLSAMRHDRNVTAGNNLAVRTAWTNTGNAPNYHQQKIAYLLRNPVTQQEYIFITSDLAQWQPSTAPVYNHSFQIPSWFGNGPARLYVGLVDTDGIPKIQLANNGDSLDRWWYDGGEVDVDNATPTAAPATAYALNSVFASSQGLQSVNILHDLSTFDNTNYYSFHVFAKFASFPGGGATNMTLMGREGFGSAGNNQFWLGYRGATARLAFSIDTGSNSYTVDADQLGVPQVDTWYKVYAQIDNVAKQIGIQIGEGVMDTLSYTGSPRTDLNLDFSVAGGGFPYYFDGQLAEARVFNKLLVSADRSVLYNGNLALPYSRLTNTMRYGLRYSWEMTETSGPRIDIQQNKGLNAIAAPTRVQIA